MYSALLVALETQDIQNDVDTPLQRPPRGNPDVPECRPPAPSSSAPHNCGSVNSGQLGSSGPRGPREGDQWEHLIQWDWSPHSESNLSLASGHHVVTGGGWVSEGWSYSD